MRVRDKGIGMRKREVEKEMKNLSKINEMERRKEESEKEWRKEGKGMGMKMKKEMVEEKREKFEID